MSHSERRRSSLAALRDSDSGEDHVVEVPIDHAELTLRASSDVGAESHGSDFAGDGVPPGRFTFGPSGIPTKLPAPRAAVASRRSRSPRRANGRGVGQGRARQGITRVSPRSDAVGLRHVDPVARAKLPHLARIREADQPGHLTPPLTPSDGRPFVARPVASSTTSPWDKPAVLSRRARSRATPSARIVRHGPPFRIAGPDTATTSSAFADVNANNGILGSSSVSLRRCTALTTWPNLADRRVVVPTHICSGSNHRTGNAHAIVRSG